MKFCSATLIGEYSYLEKNSVVSQVGFKFKNNLSKSLVMGIGVLKMLPHV